MSASGDRRGARFYVGFLIAALIVAGGLSYFASPDPDGLDTVALSGCRVVAGSDGAAAEKLDGACIAQSAQGHATEAGPLAGYSIMGGEGTVGLAGVVGVLVTAVLAGGLFWLLRRRDGASTDRAGPVSGSWSDH